MLDWTTCQAVERSPDKVSGAWVFRGTRVPVSALFTNLEGGATIDEFLEWFPGVTREQAKTVLEYASRSLGDPLAAGRPSMRILLDHNVPERLRRLLTEHHVKTAYERGWSVLTNGELLRTTEAAGFGAMMTTDRGIRHQQNLAGRKLSLIVLSTNDWSWIRRAKSVIVEAASAIRRGSLVEIEIPGR